MNSLQIAPFPQNGCYPFRRSGLNLPTAPPGRGEVGTGVTLSPGEQWRSRETPNREQVLPRSGASRTFGGALDTCREPSPRGHRQGRGTGATLSDAVPVPVRELVPPGEQVAKQRDAPRSATWGRSRVASASAWWDNPTMAMSTADAKRRVVLPAARPGDVFDIQSQGEGRLLLVRLEPPKPAPRMSMASSLEAIAAAPLRPKMTWDALKAVTREP